MTRRPKTGHTGKTEPSTVPGRPPLLGHTAALLRRHLAFRADLRKRGPVARIHLGPLPLHLVTAAELAHQVLTGETAKFDKGISADKLRRAFGNGLVGINGDFHRRQRRMIRPAFHRRSRTRYSETMTAPAADVANSRRDGQVLRLDRVVRDPAISVVGRTVFSADSELAVSAEIRAHPPTSIRLGAVHALSPAGLEKPPIPENRRVDPAVAPVHRVVDDVLVDRAATVDDLRRPPNPRRVISEVPRRYPPWLVLRRTNTSVPPAGVRVPAGTEVGFSAHALHHDPRHHDDPARSDPDRRLPDRAALPKGAYVPFAGGPHHCPGHAFAHIGIAVVAATPAARRRLVPVPGVPVRPGVTGLLDPNRLPMTVLSRRCAA
ncbi:cytochrome P450 [Saccharothrix saharensis]|uniref:Cytochrome P450 n=1 Tax=Saccharothrix saharensis TaxID=571190 RepID=A0A543J5Y3_9PSEU|nr:cytochrome P450 [Saccharothrix saharensis]TQM78250.1 cytochrome P450 [Saccharothrix saharensis]